MQKSNIDRPYGDTLMVVVPRVLDVPFIKRTFVNPYVNANGILAHDPILKILKAMGVTPQDIHSGAGSSTAEEYATVYHFYKSVMSNKTKSNNPWWENAEGEMVDTRTPVPGQQGKRSFNIVILPAEAIPGYNWAKINMPKIAVIDGRREDGGKADSKYLNDLVDNVFVHNGSTPNLRQGVDSILTRLGFDV